MHKYLFFFFLLFFLTDFVCVCLLVQCPEATLTQFQCLRQTDSHTDRHTVSAARGVVLALGPEAMWRARSGVSSTRTNLSPFTKDLRGGEHPRVYGIFGSSASAEHRLSKVKFVPCSPLCSSGLFLWVPLACSSAPRGASPRHGDELQQGLFEMWGGCSNIFKCTPADCILHIPAWPWQRL